MDEIPFMIDPSKNFTYEIEGKNEIILKKCSKYREFFTCCLLIASNGDKGPTLLIFKSASKKLANTVHKKNENLYVSYNKRGWMNNELFKNWYKVIYKNIKRQYESFHSILLCESALSHTKDNDDIDFKDIILIPKGATPILQPIDVAVGKPFKDNVRKYFSKFFIENTNNLTESGFIKKPS